MMIVGSVFLMSFQDALIKFISSDMTLWQIYVLRSALALILLGALPGLTGKFERPQNAHPTQTTHFIRASHLFRTALSSWILARSALLVLMYICIYAAVPVLNLSVIGAGFYTGPLFIAVLSALLLGEPVGRRGWLAIFCGFAGVLVILRPGSDDFLWVAVLPILAGLFYALAAIITRSRCRTASPVGMAFSLNIALFATGSFASLFVMLWQPTPAEIATAPFLFASWARMGSTEWGIIGVLAVLIVLIGMGLAAAYQSAPPVIIATFDYTYLLFAACWSLVLFADPPDMGTLIGMALIAGAGLLVVYR